VHDAKRKMELLEREIWRGVFPGRNEMEKNVYQVASSVFIPASFARPYSITLLSFLYQWWRKLFQSGGAQLHVKKLWKIASSSPFT